MGASRRWRDGLAAWAIPQQILDAAPVSPWGFSVEGFADRAARQREEPTPGHVAARTALAGGGSVLDVGCGAGAASLPLVPPATRLLGTDQSEAMLTAFAAAAAALGVDAATYPGAWPAVAEDVPAADVVVCQDVVYNVPDLAPFVAALTTHARRRVVVVLPGVHPMTWTAPYWRELHGIDRPDRPTVEDAIEVIVEATGAAPDRASYVEPTLFSRASADEAVAHVRTRLCLPAERDDEIRAAIAATPVPIKREAWVLTWPGGA